MGTQKAIAKQMIEQEGDDVWALKGNQGSLNDDVRLFLETEIKKTHRLLLRIVMKKPIKVMVELKCANAL